MKRTEAELIQEVEDLQRKVRELEETFSAINLGEVDAIVVSKGDTQQVYTLKGPTIRTRHSWRISRKVHSRSPGPG